jgi:hypothetical protein
VALTLNNDQEREKYGAVDIILSLLRTAKAPK